MQFTFDENKVTTTCFFFFMGLVDDDTRCQVSGCDIVSLSLLSLTKYSSVDSNITPYYENTERTRNKDFNETKQALLGLYFIHE